MEFLAVLAVALMVALVQMATQIIGEFPVVVVVVLLQLKQEMALGLVVVRVQLTQQLTAVQEAMEFRVEAVPQIKELLVLLSLATAVLA
jgi:hypothetical protein